jgi:AhpD family alkylhydroperoxidase
VRLFDRILFEKAAPLQIRYLTRHDYSRAPALARAVLDQMDADFLIGPPLTVHIPNPELMAGVWSAARECLAAGRAGRPLREVVAAVVSRLNACPYCYDIHTSMLHSFGEAELARAVWRREAMPDARVQSAAEWAAATLSPDAAVLAAPPFSRTEAPAIIGTAVGFHYLNRIVNVFLDASPVPLKGQGWVKGQLIRFSGRILQPRLSAQTLQPGQFLIPLAGTLPAEFAWATGNRHIAAGFQRFAATAEAAGQESVDPAVRQVVTEFLASWRGDSPGLGRAWLEGVIAPLDPELRPAARLALLSAVASYQVDQSVVAEYARYRPGDRHLINLVSWSCYAAARRVSSWLRAPA